MNPPWSLRVASLALTLAAGCELGQPVVGGRLDATVDEGPDAAPPDSSALYAPAPDVDAAPDAAPPDAPPPLDAADAAADVNVAADLAPEAPDTPDVPDVLDARPPSCDGDLDCAGDPAGRVCDTATRRCVRCLGARGCDPGQLCCAAACVDPASTAAHCGACGRACALPNATATCAMGACGVGVCTMGFSDCDTTPANGCEASVATDATRCGACGTRCAAGQSCVAGRCTNDCRNGGALPCGSPLVCDFLTGSCLDPTRACVLSGTPVDCGTETMPQSCGPGSQCDRAARRCVAAAACRRVVCDATGLCRGADCMLGGGGGVRSLTLDAPTVGAAGAADGIRLRATVDAESLCGLNVGFEVRREDGYYLSAGNDMGIWRVSTTGTRTMHLPRIGGVSGLAADRTGALYYVISRTGSVQRVTDVGGTVRDDEGRWMPYPLIPRASTPAGHGTGAAWVLDGQGDRMPYTRGTCLTAGIRWCFHPA